MMKPENQNLGGNATDQLAGMIAKQIIFLRSVIACKLNSLVNQCSLRRQKWLLFLFITIATAGIIANLMTYEHTFKGRKDTRNYEPTYIGKPSNLPKPAPKPIKFFNS